MSDDFLNVEYNLKEKKIFYKSFIKGNYVNIKVSYSNMFSIDGFVDGDIRTRLGISPKKTFKLWKANKNIIIDNIYNDIDNTFAPFIKEENRIIKNIPSAYNMTLPVYHNDEIIFDIEPDNLAHLECVEYYYREFERMDIFTINGAKISKVFNIWTACNDDFMSIVNNSEEQILEIINPIILFKLYYSKSSLLNYSTYKVDKLVDYNGNYTIEYKYDSRGILYEIETGNNKFKSLFKRKDAIDLEGNTIVSIEYPMPIYKIFGDFIIDDKIIMKDTICINKNGIIETIIKTIND